MQANERRHNSLLVLDPEQRQVLARQLTTVRRHERGFRYQANRGEGDYDILLGGFFQSLDYVRQLEGTNLVLDIGAGATRAIWEISEMPEARGLNFKATTLIYRPEIEEYFLGRKRTHITPAEILRGIEDNSVGLALAVYSITYSINPAAAINRVDEVLVPGGILKGIFRFTDRKDSTSALTTPKEPFEERLRDLGYDIAYGGKGVLLAKKPGGNVVISAQDLIEADLATSLDWPGKQALKLRKATKGDNVGAIAKASS